MVTERTMATMPRPQHKACISFGFLSQVHVVIRQLGSTTSTLTMLERKSEIFEVITNLVLIVLVCKFLVLMLLGTYLVH